MCCYYPTTTVVIDDDIDFLGLLTQNLGMTSCKTYNSPNYIIPILNEQNPFERIKKHLIKTELEDRPVSPEDRVILYNMKDLHKEVYNKDRFKDVSVIIVDYHMDELDGLSVCEHLSKHPAKKILLTGSADPLCQGK